MFLFLSGVKATKNKSKIIFIITLFVLYFFIHHWNQCAWNFSYYRNVGFPKTIFWVYKADMPWYKCTWLEFPSQHAHGPIIHISIFNIRLGVAVIDFCLNLLIFVGEGRGESGMNSKAMRAKSQKWKNLHGIYNYKINPYYNINIFIQKQYKKIVWIKKN